MQFIAKTKNPQGELRGDNPFLQGLPYFSRCQYLKHKRQDFSVGC